MSKTPLTIWVIAPIYIAVYAIIILIFELIKKHKAKNASVNQ